MGICGSTKTDETVSCFEKLKTTAFSYRLTDDQLMEFAVYWTVLRIGKDEKVEGLPQGDFYIVMDGDIDLKLSDAVICHKTRGDCLGVPQEQKSQTGEELTAVARTPTVLLQLTADNWEIYAAENPTLKDKILPLMGQSTKRLAKVECFEGIPSARLTLLNMMFKYVVLRKGDTLFKEESLGSSLYVVLEGAVQAVARIRTNERKSVGSAAEADKERESVFDVSKSKMLHEFKANEIFGEISLIMDIPRTAAIVASEDALLLELTRHSFQSFLRTVPDRDLHLNRIIKVRIAQHFRKYKVPFFAAIPDEKYSILSSYCEIVQIAANTVIFKEGDVGHEFYMIAHGEVKVTVKKENKDGKLEDLELTRMGPGMYFGEIALVQETARTATLTTVKRSVLLSISKANFEKFFNEAPEAIADFEIKLARYNVQLRSVMYHPLGLEYFTRHVKAEFAEENIEFWKECRDYRHLTYADIATEDVTQFKSRNASIIFVDKKSLDGYGEGDEAEETLLEKEKPEEPKEKDTTKEQPRPSSSPRKTASPEKRLADYNAAFNIYGKNDVMMLVDFKRLMELVGINTDLAEEEVEHLMAAVGFTFTPIATSEEAKHEKSVLESKVEKSKVEKSDKKEDSDPEQSVKLGGMQIMIEKHITAKLPRDKFIKAMMEANRQSQPKTPSRTSTPSPRRTFSSVVLWKMQKALVDNEIAKLQQVCELIDTEGVGKISFYNFQTVMKQLGYDMPREKLKSKFDQMDDKNTGEASFEEFVKFMISDKRSKDSFKELLRRRATYIYNEYVSPSAPKQVNIQGPTRKKVKEDVEANIVSLATFDKAEQEILALLSTDTFARFKQSQLFQQFLDSAASYTHVKSGDEKKKGKEKPKHFRVSSMDKSLDGGGGKKEKAHERHESISIDSLMKTLGTDDLFSIRVGGLGRGAGGEGGKEAEKPVAMSSLTEEDEESEAS